MKCTIKDTLFILQKLPNKHKRELYKTAKLLKHVTDVWYIICQHDTVGRCFISWQLGDDCLHHLCSVYHHWGENSPSHICTTLSGTYMLFLGVSSLPLPQFKDISGSHHVLVRALDCNDGFGCFYLSDGFHIFMTYPGSCTISRLILRGENFKVFSDFVLCLKF